MNTRKKADLATTYTYRSLDGSIQTIRVGEDGVTEEMLILLRDSDREMDLQDRYQEENSSYEYRNAVHRFEKISNEDEDHPRDRIADPKADIMKVLFPDTAEDSLLLKKLENAMTHLTDGQRDLIYELYGFCKSMADVAREQDVSYEAIQNRRSKIFRRLKKLIEAEND